MTDPVLFHSPGSGSGQVTGLLDDSPRAKACYERLDDELPVA